MTKYENTNTVILEFLDAYKNLDELCKQIFASDTGVSRYIEEMVKENQNAVRVQCWNNDYKQLKHMRWVRNQLVHDVNSFQKNIVTFEDIEWIKNFHSRIMSCTDPFAVLYQHQNHGNNKAKVQEDVGKERDKGISNSQSKLIMAILLGIVLLTAIFISFVGFVF